MAKLLLSNGKVLSDYGEPYFVAEVNTSHNGSLETAKVMIDKAIEVGCSCVKFQSWSSESLYSKTYYIDNPIAKRIVSKFAFNEDQLLIVAQYCKDRGIDFSSTPYSKKEVDFLIEKCSVPYIKIASMDINNHHFLEYIAKTKYPIVLSTGMSEVKEIRDAINIIEKAGNKNLCLLHCISIYPPEISTIHLNNILGLREEFPYYPIGFSDHSIGTEMAIASIALGAALIEKHFTLDKKKIGMDNQMATEPDEMLHLVQSCKNVHSALGNKERVLLEDERMQRIKMRRSIIVNKDIKAGTKLTIEDLDSKRPGTGISPNKINEIVGKVLNCDKESDTLLYEKDYH